MSDILIKNMKMPENCLHCGFSHMASDCLKIWIICKPKDISVADDDAVKEGRPDWCPLAEVKHGKWGNRGKWLNKEITADFHVVGKCSVCKERRRIDNFCPNCGARMDGE